MTLPQHIAEIARQLDKVPLFQGLAADVLARIRDQAHSKAVGMGESFFNEGDDAQAFYVLTRLSPSPKTCLNAEAGPIGRSVSHLSQAPVANARPSTTGGRGRRKAKKSSRTTR